MAFTLTLKGPIPPKSPKNISRSAFWSLPRSLPACYSPFDVLELEDVRFPLFSDIGKVIRELRQSPMVRLINVSWATNATFLPLVCRSWNRHTYIVTTKNCTDDVLLALQAYSALIARLHPRGKPDVYPMLVQSETENVFNLIRVVHASGVRPEALAEDLPPLFVIEDGAVSFPRDIPCECLCAQIGQRPDPWNIVLRFYITDPTYNMAVQLHLEVAVIVIETHLSGPQLEIFATHLDWEMFKAHLVHLRALRCVVFAFQEVKSVTGFAAIRREMLDQSAIGQLKIRCVYKAQDEYSAAHIWAEVHPANTKVIYGRWFSFEEMVENAL